MKKISEAKQIFLKSIIFTILFSVFESLMLILGPKVSKDFHLFGIGIVSCIGALMYFYLKTTVKNRWRYLINILLIGFLEALIFGGIIPLSLEWGTPNSSRWALLEFLFYKAQFIFPFFTTVCCFDIIHNVYLNIKEKKQSKAYANSDIEYPKQHTEKKSLEVLKAILFSMVYSLGTYGLFFLIRCLDNSSSHEYLLFSSFPVFSVIYLVFLKKVRYPWIYLASSVTFQGVFYIALFKIQRFLLWGVYVEYRPWLPLFFITVDILHIVWASSKAFTRKRTI